jgi:hypothetical protein
LIDVFVIDELDRELAPTVESLGLRCGVAQTMMTDSRRKSELARAVLTAARA